MRGAVGFVEAGFEDGWESDVFRCSGHLPGHKETMLTAFDNTGAHNESWCGAADDGLPAPVPIVTVFIIANILGTACGYQVAPNGVASGAVRVLKNQLAGLTRPSPKQSSNKDIPLSMSRVDTQPDIPCGQP